MPISVTTTAAPGTSYGDIRVGECQVHQGLIAVAGLGAQDDASGSLPVGLPLLAAGGPVTGAGQTAFGLVGPEAVKLGAVNHFGNMFISGTFNRDMIEANLGRVLSADELSAIAAAGIKLI